MADLELKKGHAAPDFCLPNQDEQDVCLKDAAGKWLVLYFYPKDNTSGCTLEAENFTENLADFEKSGALVWGVSPDSPKSHRKFIDKKSLGVTLLSDPEHDMLTKYGVWQLKKMYGKEYHGVVRSTFLIDPDGKIAHIWPKVKVKGHVKEVLSTLQQLQ